MTKRAVLAASLVLVAACATRAPEVLSKPRLEQLAPSDLLPNDLDFVVRIDARRLRGEPALEVAARGLAKTDRSGMLRTILPSLERARAIFVGGRFMSDGFHGDGVVAIELAGGGDIEARAVDPSFRPMRGAPDRVAMFERAPGLREEAALEVMLEGGGIVLATAAEADAVMRVTRSGPDADRIDPPARGLASFAGRLPSAASNPAAPATPTFRRIARGLVRYAGFVEGGDALHAEIELFYASAEEAADAAGAARSVLTRLAEAPGPLRQLADSMELARDAAVVRLRATVPFAVVAELH
jgi:hypothetical protein